MLSTVSYRKWFCGMTIVSDSRRDASQIECCKPVEGREGER